MHRIVYLTRRAEGGIRRHLVDLLSNLDRTEFEPVVIGPARTELAGELAALDIPLYELDVSDRPSAFKGAVVVLRLARLFKRLRPDLIHIHGHAAALVGVAARILSARRTPLVISVHNFPSYQTANRVLRLAGSVVQRGLSRRACRIIAVSKALRDSLVSAEGLRPESVTVIYNGIKPCRPADRSADIRAFREVHGVPADALVVGVIGRMVPVKGYDVLLDAARRLAATRPDVWFVLVGHGPQLKTLRRLAVELGIEGRVVFPGFSRDLELFFRLFDVFVFPSLREPFGIVLLEAMSAGTPVVASRSGGAPEIVEDGVTGLLVPPGDAAALAAAVERVLADKDLAESLAGAAAEAVGKRFSLDVMTERTEVVYRECLKRGRA